MSLKVTLNWSKQADGSCLLEELSTGDIKNREESSVVLVTVQGPTAAKSKIELVDQATVQISFCPLNYPPGGESDVWAGRLERLLSSHIVQVEEYPRSLVQISVQPLNIGPRFLACAVNAIYLALLNAAIPLKRPFVAFGESGAKGSSLYVCDPLGDKVFFEECELYSNGFDTNKIRETYEHIKGLYEMNV